MSIRYCTKFSGQWTTDKLTNRTNTAYNLLTNVVDSLDYICLYIGPNNIASAQLPAFYYNQHRKNKLPTSTYYYYWLR